MDVDVASGRLRRGGAYLKRRGRQEDSRVPVGKQGKFQVDGQCVLVLDGTNTQTVNVFAGPDRTGPKEYVVRIRQPLFTSKDELAPMAFANVDELKAYLIASHHGEIEEPPERVFDRLSKQLAGIADDLGRGGSSPSPTVREFLSWVGAQRRVPSVVEGMRGSLAECGLITDPDFESAYIDSPIAFVVASSRHEATPQTEDETPGGTGSAEVEAYSDATYRISKFPSASKKPKSALPDDTLRSAVTKMILNEVSHLPVMSSEREVKGLLSMRNFLSKWRKADPDDLVGGYMDTHVEIVESRASLFTVLSRLQDTDYILVRGPDKRIVGSITAHDMTPQFRELTEPFLLLSEIENHIRRLVAPRFTLEELQETCDPDHLRDLESVADLNFGDYVYLLQNEEHWARLGLEDQREDVMEDMRTVNKIRNRVMHFDPDGIESEQLDSLRKFSRYVRTL